MLGLVWDVLDVPDVTILDGTRLRYYYYLDSPALSVNTDNPDNTDHTDHTDSDLRVIPRSASSTLISFCLQPAMPLIDGRHARCKPFHVFPPSH